MKHSYLTLILFLSLHIVCNSQNTATPKSQSLSNGIVSRWIASAKNNVEVLPMDGLAASSVANDAPVLSNHTSSIAPDASTALNELVSGYGGILINHGWIRILGAGCKRLNRSLPEWNKGKSFTGNGESQPYVLIADDAVGGFFAINNGGFDKNDVNTVYYYGPNGLNWQTTGLDYNRFMNFCFSGDIADFYSDFYWKGWQEDVKKLSGNEVVSCYPFLWTKEGKELKCNRKTVSIQKVWELYHHNDIAAVEKRNSPKTGKNNQTTTRKSDNNSDPSGLVYQKHK